MLKLIANIEPFGGEGWLAWINNEKFKGLVVQAESPREAFNELMISLKVKIAFDYKLNIENIEHKTFATEADMEKFLNSMESEPRKKWQTEIPLSHAFC